VSKDRSILVVDEEARAKAELEQFVSVLILKY